MKWRITSETFGPWKEHYRGLGRDQVQGYRAAQKYNKRRKLERQKLLRAGKLWRDIRSPDSKGECAAKQIMLDAARRCAVIDTIARFSMDPESLEFDGPEEDELSKAEEAVSDALERCIYARDFGTMQEHSDACMDHMCAEHDLWALQEALKRAETYYG